MDPKIPDGDRDARFTSGFQDPFSEQLMNDPEITGRVPAKQIEQAFFIERQLRNVGKIFKQVFGE